jgi:hypothetical protein
MFHSLKPFWFVSLALLIGGYLVAMAQPPQVEAYTPAELSVEDRQEIQDLLPGHYVKASNSEEADLFGFSVAIHGNTAVVGAIWEDSHATGINGDQNNNLAPDSGAVYVFVQNSEGEWSQQAYLKASNTDAGDKFGQSVAIYGDTIVVGAYAESSNATGVNGNQTDNSANEAGAAYVFVRNDETWSQQAYLKASNAEAGDWFGDMVAIAGDTIVVGAKKEDSNATGVNDNQNDNSNPWAGAAYVFQRTGTEWNQEAYLKASNSNASDEFGEAIAITLYPQPMVVIGAHGESSNATGVDGNQDDNSMSGAGAAYVFVRSEETWSQQAYLKASNTDTNDFFGFSVAFYGPRLVVGAPLEASNATGVNGDQSDNSAQGAGAVYLFYWNGEIWEQEAYIKASNTHSNDSFGQSVAIDGYHIVAGAWREDSSATGVDGDEQDESMSNAGAAYLFTFESGVWSQEAYLKASNTETDDQFGLSLALSNGQVWVSAVGEDSQATGIDGNQDDNSAPSAGAIYTFDQTDLATYPLTVHLTGTGVGEVVTNLGEIQCGITCTAHFSEGSLVNLEAIAPVGSVFTGWSGAITGTNPVAALQINMTQTITASFYLTNTNTYTITPTAGTGGTISPNTPQTVNEGGSLLFTITPQQGYSIADVAVDGVSQGAVESYLFEEITADHTISASFTINQYELTVVKEGTGVGLVTSDPAGIHCGEDCAETLDFGTVITLTAEANVGSTFAGWNGACSGTSACVVTIEQAETITATFTLNQYELTVTHEGTGAGVIISDPAGINCGGDCAETLDFGTVITLTAVANVGSTFAGWSGACSGTAACVLTIEQTEVVTATFTLNQYELTVVKAGTGTGLVTSDPAGINCGDDCAEELDFGTVVTLTATAANDSTFIGWSGACSGIGVCVVTVEEAESVTATFTFQPKIYLPVILRP